MQNKNNHAAQRQNTGRPNGYTPRPTVHVSARFRSAPAIVPKQAIDVFVKPVPALVAKSPVQLQQLTPVHNRPVQTKPASALKAPNAIAQQVAQIQPLTTPYKHTQPTANPFSAPKGISKPPTHKHATARPAAIRQSPSAVTPKKYQMRQHTMLQRVPTMPVPERKRIARLKQKMRFELGRKKRGYILSGLAIALFVVGVGVNAYSFTVSKKIEAQTSNNDSVVSGGGEQGRPGNESGYSEEQPDIRAMNKYTVAPDLPKFVKIGSLGVWSRVVRVGADANNQIGTPRNVFDVGWYEGGAKPGQPGVVFMDGHVLGPTKGGVFASLKNIKPGSEVVITMGNETQYKYRVTSTEKLTTAQVDMGKLLTPKNATEQTLVLMTCNGTYLKDQETYDKRFIVYAVRAN